MALQSSGAIALDDIHQEAGGSANSNCTINDADIRGLIDASDGANTSFDDWYGASSFADVGIFSSGNIQNSGAAQTNIERIAIPSTGNSTAFGDLGIVRTKAAAFANATRYILAGGHTTSGGAHNASTNTIQYRAVASDADTQDFGDLADGVRSHANACGNNTRMIIIGGMFSYNSGEDNINVIEYITTANTGNATDFGNTTAGVQSSGTCNTTTRGIRMGGTNGTSDIIEYVTISSTGNATNFGSLTRARRSPANGVTCSATRGVCIAGSAGGGGNTNTIDYITMASAGNATDFGDTSQVLNEAVGCSSLLRSVFGGGSTNNTNELEYITIASTGNATDYGDLLHENSTNHHITSSGASSNHGGVA